MTSVRTVLGDVAADRLGRCDYHEHLFQVSPLLAGDELDDEHRSGEEAGTLKAAGVDAMVEATPTGLGRDPAAVARISARTGLAVVHVSGAHRHEHYPAGHWLPQLPEAELVRRFTADVTTGLPAADLLERGAPAQGPDGDPVRAGMLKAGVGYWRIDPFERRVLAAVGAAAAETGVPVMVHTEYGSAAWEVLDALAADGVAADRVVLAHIDRNLDPGLHAELTAAGAYLGYDGMARHREAPDSAIVDCLARVAADGDPDRLLLGGDVARRSRYRSYGGIPGLDYLPVRFLPRLRKEGGDGLVDRMLVANPARLLSIQP
jgi:phosphotriesterase-related protein